MAIISTIGLMALSIVACAGGKNADPAEGSVPTPLPTRVEIENRVASTRGGDKGCEVFHELEEGIAAGAFSLPPSKVPNGPYMLWKRTILMSRSNSSW